MGNDFPTIPFPPASIRGMGARSDHGKADAQGHPGTGSELFEVNMWARDAVQVEGLCFGKILDFGKSTGPTKIFKTFQ